MGEASKPLGKGVVFATAFVVMRHEDDFIVSQEIGYIVVADSRENRPGRAPEECEKIRSFAHAAVSLNFAIAMVQSDGRIGCHVELVAKLPFFCTVDTDDCGTVG